MSETQTLEPPTEEAPTQQIPVAVHQTAAEDALDPTVNLDFEPHLTTKEKVTTLFRRIESDADLRGFEDIEGLELAVSDEQGQRQRFVVVGASQQLEYKPYERRFGRPKLERQFVEFHEGVPRFNGRRMFERKREKTIYRKSGVPWFRREDGSMTIARRREKIDPVTRKTVLVEKYDQTGNSTGTESMRLADFYLLAGAGLTADGRGTEHPQASWNWKRRNARQAPEHGDDLELGLSWGGTPIFEDITRQLENRGITNWKHLRWKLQAPIPERVPGKDVSKKGMQVRSRTQEIIHDGPDQESGYKVDGENMYPRTFWIRTTEEYEDGSKSVLRDVKLKDYELWHYFEQPDALKDKFKAPPEDGSFIPEGASIWDMRMPEDTGRPSEKFEMPEAPETEDVYGLPSYPTLDEALIMLSSPELYLGRGTDDEGYALLNDHIAKIKENRGEELEYGGELQQILSETGSERFHAIVDKLHMEVFPRYATIAERLGIPITPVEAHSVSWIIEGLVKRSLENRKQGEADAFSQVLGLPHLLRDLSDEHIGDIFGIMSVKTGKKPVPKIEDGEQKIEEEVFYEFNEELIPTLPILKSPGNMSAIKKWRDNIVKPIEKQTRLVNKLLIRNKEHTGNYSIDYRETEKLGRLLSRSVSG